jgi:hypothetical protein
MLRFWVGYIEPKLSKSLTVTFIFAIVVIMTTDIIIIILASDETNVNNEIDFERTKREWNA